MTRASTELAHLFRALKAPAAGRALPKLADRARQVEWSYEQFAAALLRTETDLRDSHGGQARIKAERFPARKTSSADRSPAPGRAAAASPLAQRQGGRPARPAASCASAR